MTDSFTYDVFLCHSSKDAGVVRLLAERLRADGLRVWFEDWEILSPLPAGMRVEKLEHGLEASRALLLFASANASSPDWVELESQAARFRDPQNPERRFILLRLDQASLPDSLAHVECIDWHHQSHEEVYGRLLKASRPPPLPQEGISLSEQVEVKILSLGHTAGVLTVAFSPDGLLVLSGSEDNTVRLWETETGRCLRVLEGHTNRVWSVAWSPDGHQALSGSSDKTIRLWELQTGRCLQVLTGHTAGVNCVAWSPDGLLAISGSYDRSLRMWEAGTGFCLRVFEGHTDSVLSVAWSPDSRLVISGSDDKTVRLWETETGRCPQLLKGHTGTVVSVAWSPDGHKILSGSSDKRVRYWDAESNRCLREFEGHTDSVLSIAWSPDGRQALSGSTDKTVRLWDAQTGRCLRVLEGHTGSVWSVAWSLDGCQALSGSGDKTVRLWEAETGRCLRLFEGHTDLVRNVAWSLDGRLALSGSADKTVRLWEVQTGRCLQVLEGHINWVRSIAWRQDNHQALSGSDDMTVRIWGLEAGCCLKVLEGHSAPVWSVAWSPDGRLALSGSEDNTVRLWEAETGSCRRVFKGHTDNVLCVTWRPDSCQILSGSDDKTVRIWETETGQCLRVLEGHTGSVLRVAWSPDGSQALSGSDDKTVRLWDAETGRCLRVLEGHTGSVWSVAWSPDGLQALSGSWDETIRLWDLQTGKCLLVLEGHIDHVWDVAWSPDGHQVYSGAANGVMRVWNLTEFSAETAQQAGEVEGQVQYTNAKVLLVGESGSGKTGLSLRLALDDWQPSDSTVGAWATQWKLPLFESVGAGIEREIWLWDFGGQADQRLIHQLYMDETALAVLVFDGQKEDLFETLGQWDRELGRAARKPFTRLLAAGRVDAGGLRVSRVQVEAFCKERGYTCFLETSAKQNTGCQELRIAILEGIRWEEIPWRSSPQLFKRLKEEILRIKDEGRVLMRFNELRDALRLRLVGEDEAFKDDQLKAVIGLLAGPGAVWELAFGSWVLLQPERINAYAQAVIQTLRADEFERGCLAEERVLNGDLVYHSSMQRLEAGEERFVLLAMHQTLIERGLCLREHTDQGTLLVFPSYYRRERAELTGHPAVMVSYRFNGFLDDIYATLVVKLHHTKPFNRDQLWRYAADFRTQTGKQLGVKLSRKSEGAGELEVYFDPAIPVEEKIIFSRYVHEHLLEKGQDVQRLRYYVCPHCGTPVGNREVAMKRLGDWLDQRENDQAAGTSRKVEKAKTEEPTILCVSCEKRMPLWDEMEQCFASPEIQQRVRELLKQSEIVLDSESKERVLVGDVTSTVALAGQICREVTVGDHGIDMEIEFKDDRSEATGRKLYLQLKSGDSHLRERKSDGAKIFRIDERHVRYWMAQAFPVLLVIRSAEGEVRWMEVRDWLKRESEAGAKPVKHIVFEGERFDVMSVRRWRERVLLERTSK